MKFINKIGVCLSSVSLIVTICSCKKLVDTKAPYTSINAGNIYRDNATAASVLTGIYTSISKSNSSGFDGITSLSLFPSLSADELTLFNVNLGQYSTYYLNELSSLNV